MATELIPAGSLPVAKYAQDEVFSKISTSANFLPYLQLCGGTNKFAKRGLVPIGQYVLIRGKDQLEILGKDVACLPLNWRPKAMDTSSDDVISVFDPGDPEFSRIMSDSEESDSNCFYGPEFLLYLPDANPPCYATFLMGSKTARGKAPELKGLMNKGVTLKAILIETKKYSWHGPVITPNSTGFPVPNLEEIRAVSEKFGNPPKSEIEKAEKAPTEGDVAR